MKCPICNGEMEYGLIQCSSPISWLKTKSRQLIYSPKLYEGSVSLSAASMFKGSAVVAYNCPKCKKIIIDYGDPTSDLNYIPKEEKIDE